jgi:hypothetical protein
MFARGVMPLKEDISMPKRNVDPAFDDEEIEREDPLGEEMFAEQGFQDGPDGGPDFDAAGFEEVRDRRPGRLPQKMAGVPKADQHVQNSSDIDRPDSGRGVIHERGGDGKGDPAVGGTRP